MTEQATCKRCGRPIEIKEIGPHKREYCDDKGACRQAAYRQRKKAEANQHNVTMERIAELEAEREQAMQELKQLNERFREHQQLTSNNLSHLYGELARYRKIVDLSDRDKMVARFMLIGEQIGYVTLESVELGRGPHAWYTFPQQADDELLGRGIVAAETKWRHLADLQTTTAVAKQEKIIADLRQKLHECEKHNHRDSS